MMKSVKKENQTIWYDESLLAESPESCFDAAFWQKSGRIIGSATGRGTTWFIRAERVEAALRHYRRGGLFGKIVSDHYLFFGWEQTRSYQEFQLLKTLREAGVNVPKPVAARAMKRTFCYQADLLSEKIANARDVVSILQSQSLGAEIYQKIGAEIRKMHDAQVNHTDLNTHNILIDDDNKVWIIDFDKCSQQTGDSWKSSNLKRLQRSFEKERVKRAIQFQPLDIELIMQGYKEEQ